MMKATMNDNLTYQEDFLDEMINGEILLTSLRSTINHNRVCWKIFRAFGNQLEGKECEAFGAGMDVYLSEKDRVIPDVMIICSKDIIRDNGIYGTPDLVVEVLSPGTEKRDRGIKKNLYEICGVKEYWLANPEIKSVEVYLLIDQKFYLDEVYRIFPDYIRLSETEKEQYKTNVKVSLYDDFYRECQKSCVFGSPCFPG